MQLQQSRDASSYISKQAKSEDPTSTAPSKPQQLKSTSSTDFDKNNTTNLQHSTHTTHHTADKTDQVFSDEAERRRSIVGSQQLQQHFQQLKGNLDSVVQHVKEEAVQVAQRDSETGSSQQSAATGPSKQFSQLQQQRKPSLSSALSGAPVSMPYALQEDHPLQFHSTLVTTDDLMSEQTKRKLEVLAEQEWQERKTAARKYGFSGESRTSSDTTVSSQGDLTAQPISTPSLSQLVDKGKEAVQTAVQLAEAAVSKVISTEGKTETMFGEQLDQVEVKKNRQRTAEWRASDFDASYEPVEMHHNDSVDSAVERAVEIMKHDSMLGEALDQVGGEVKKSHWPWIPSGYSARDEPVEASQSDFTSRSVGYWQPRAAEESHRHWRNHGSGYSAANEPPEASQSDFTSRPVQYVPHHQQSMQRAEQLVKAATGAAMEHGAEAIADSSKRVMKGAGEVQGAAAEQIKKDAQKTESWLSRTGQWLWGGAEQTEQQVENAVQQAHDKVQPTTGQIKDKKQLKGDTSLASDADVQTVTAQATLHELMSKSQRRAGEAEAEFAQQPSPSLLQRGKSTLSNEWHRVSGWTSQKTHSVKETVHYAADKTEQEAEHLWSVASEEAKYVKDKIVSAEAALKEKSKEQWHKAKEKLPRYDNQGEIMYDAAVGMPIIVHPNQDKDQDKQATKEAHRQQLHEKIDEAADKGAQVRSGVAQWVEDAVQRVEDTTKHVGNQVAGQVNEEASKLSQTTSTSAPNVAQPVYFDSQNHVHTLHLKRLADEKIDYVKHIAEQALIGDEAVWFEEDWDNPDNERKTTQTSQP